MTICSPGLGSLHAIWFGVGLGIVSTRLNPTRANMASQIKTSIFNKVELLFKMKKPRASSKKTTHRQKFGSQAWRQNVACPMNAAALRSPPNPSFNI